MTRKGYNSDWLWKEWGRQSAALVQAAKDGRYEAAEMHLTEMEQTSRDLDALERGARPSSEPCLPFEP